jgi:tetratricopeptide (TPR) repeat protein
MYKAAVSVLLAMALCACQSGNTATAPTAEQQREYREAFQQMMAQPGDLDAVTKYATAATKAGDYEAAVAAYEGMLMVDANLPRVKLELGLLYYRLKSYEMSRTYLEAALQSPTLPADVRKPAEQLLAKMPTQSGTTRHVTPLKTT